MKIIKTQQYNNIGLFGQDTTNDEQGNFIQRPLVDPNTISDYSAQDFKYQDNVLDDLKEPHPTVTTEDIFKHHNTPYDKHEDIKIYTFNYGKELHVLEFDDDSPMTANDWIYQIQDPLDYISVPDFNEQFWSDVSPDLVVYHGTSEENAENIAQTGLSPRDETRGINNRSTGSAVFSTFNKEAAEIYGGVIIEILIGKMAADGYNPRVSLEGPIEEQEAYEALASKIGLEDFYHEVEHGIDSDTMIIYGEIPPQYLRITNDQ